MGYYGRRSYRSWRSRGWGGSRGPSKYSVLKELFGGAVGEIRKAFLNLEDKALDELFTDYGEIYGESAERYARKTFPDWECGNTKLSGRTMERLIELVPPYLSAEQRFTILKHVVKIHKRKKTSEYITIDVKEPSVGFEKIQKTLLSMSHDDILAHVPQSVMDAAKWLYDDDITASRGMLAEIENIENDLIKTKAKREIELLKRAISSGQVKSASYTVEMPSGNLYISAYSPKKCFVASICFGEFDSRTQYLKKWRDLYLVKYKIGLKFIILYYEHGECLAKIINKSKLAKKIFKIVISFFILIQKKFLN